MRRSLVIWIETISMVIFLLPRFRTLGWIKASFLRLLGAHVGKRVVFYPGIWIFPGRDLHLGDDVDLAYGALITTSGGVSIGDRTLVGYGARILSSNHHIPAVPQRIFAAGHTDAPVVIEQDVWIGANAIILPGVTIGEGAVVAAGSVVTRDVAPWTVVGGIPARELRHRR